MIESITSIGIFIDGGYFTKINQALEEKLSLNIDITFFFKFIKEKIAYEYNLNTEFCQITESHYFRGRYRVNDANNKHLLFSERKFEDSLIENDVIFHYKHLREIQKEGEINVIEKGIDVWFALEAYELSLFRKFDFVILITGDADHEMLIKKLKALKIHTILLTWDLSPESATARLLREEACKHIELSEIAIEDKDLIKKICRSKQKRLKKHLFLLGGHDLEMQTIVQILTDRNVIFKDRYLQWDNALLSQYEEEIQQYGNKEPFIIYGVELKEDITPPTNYIRIDHHNEYATYPSALEQVASILDHPLNRYQTLVAANDKAYIPGMLEIGASHEEINLIRQEDRKAQGVIEDDEKLAQEAITNGTEKIGSLYVVFTTANKFSPICDRLYPYEKLLIYTPNELIYYGKGIKFYPEDIKANTPQ